MTADVPKSTTSVVSEAPPFERVDFTAERAVIGNRALPDIPVDAFWDP